MGRRMLSAAERRDSHGRSRDRAARRRNRDVLLEPGDVLHHPDDGADAPPARGHARSRRPGRWPRRCAPLAGPFARAALHGRASSASGLLAIPTLSGSAAYAFAETFGWTQGLDQKLRGRALLLRRRDRSRRRPGIALDFADVNPVRALYWSAVVNGLLAPFLLVAILAVASDRKLMRASRARCSRGSSSGRRRS